MYFRALLQPARCCLKIVHIKWHVMYKISLAWCFRTLIERANDWLKENPGQMLWKCETVIFKLGTDENVNTDDVYFMESAYGTNVFLMGLRSVRWNKHEYHLLSDVHCIWHPTSQIEIVSVISVEWIEFEYLKMGCERIDFNQTGHESALNRTQNLICSLMEWS